MDQRHVLGPPNVASENMINESFLGSVMPLVALKDLFARAQRQEYALGAFNAIGLEHTQAIVEAAEKENSPIILQLSQNAITYHLDDIIPIGLACAKVSEAASIPVALHLDHATTWELCEAALDIGFSSVMYDASHLPLEHNAELTADIAERVHARGGSIEGELGVVGGKDGIQTSQHGKTDPSIARWYVDATGIDAFAVAVGTSHYMVDKTASLDFELISRLGRETTIPLVLHGSSGVSDEDVVEAVRRGITKINIATELNKAFTTAIRSFLTDNPEVVDPRKYLQPARDAVIDVVRRRLRVLGSANRA